MKRIQTLREDVYKKIAAGEVVERPLSAVKELVENALDAGADTITVEVMDGGKRLIKVIDNGHGFDPNDIETAFKNHSTSKISELRDFDTLHTLGFRGEALPSILEVSKIELKTSDNDDGAGIHCVFEDGEPVLKEQVACNRGSTIIVRDLFHNFPVRMKFLKTERTELKQIISFLEPMTLVNYGKSFELVHNGKTVFSYKQAAQLKDRIYQVLGREILERLQEVSFEFDNYKLTGFISKLNTGLSVKKHQYFFVNGRSVREKTLIAALNNTFQPLLEKHRSPVAVLLMEFPPQEVDVNIHPMKLEIKFVDSSSIYRFVKRAIESGFGRAEEYAAFPDVSPFGGGAEPYPVAPRNDYGGGFPVDGQGVSGPGASHIMHPPQGAQAPATAVEFQQAPLFDGDFGDKEDFIIIGQYKNSYILVEKNSELLIVDQHNAQERVNFDCLKKEYSENNVASINPLFPLIIELTPSEAARLDSRKMEILEKAGFRLEPLTGNSYDIKSFPQVLDEPAIKDAIRTIIHMKEKEDDANVSFEDSILAEIACKSAIKINHKLFPAQMKTIVTNLFNTSNPYFCPHKRPIIIEYTLEQIEKMMKRR
jgi:DNA mismatch repair protein MutL